MIQKQQHQQKRGSAAFVIAFIALGSLMVLEVNSYTVNRFGDVLIRNDGVTFQCDKIICPKDAVRCQVTKSLDESDTNFSIRKNICYGPNGHILLQNSIKDPAVQGQSQQLNVVVTDDGHSTSSSVISSDGIQSFDDSVVIDGEALQQSIQQQVQQTLDNVSKNLERSLGGLWHGFN